MTSRETTEGTLQEQRANSVPETTQPPAYFDTETPEARELRYQKQVELENLIHEGKLVGIPARERIDFIRKYIFSQFPNVKGLNSVNIRHEGVRAFVKPWLLSSKRFNYPSGHDLPQDLDHYFGDIDMLSQQVAQIEDPKQKLEATKRLAAAVYSFGIMVHPFPDGNGQTLRMLALSYLNEHSPDTYGNARLPKRLKKTQSGGGGIHGSVEYDILKKKPARLTDNEDLAMLVEFQTMNLPTAIELDDEDKEEAARMQEIQRPFWDDNANAERIYNIFKPYIPELTLTNYAAMTKQIHSAYDRVSQQLSEVGITKSMSQTARAFSDVKNLRGVDLVRQYLEYTLKTSRGRKWVTEYVTEGKMIDQQGIHPDLRWIEKVEQASLESVEKQMGELLSLASEQSEGIKKFSLTNILSGIGLRRSKRTDL